MPTSGTVHVWSADLSSVPSWVAGLLDVEERERAARVAAPVSRDRWVAARGLLRVLLGERTGLDPASLRFDSGRYGKPSLAGSEIGFNVSHSDDRVLYAISSGIEVGVDIEVASRGVDERRAVRRDDVAVARRVLGEAVAKHLEGLPESRRPGAFLRAWVAHEARVKCLGLGLGAALDADGGRPSRGAEEVRPWTCELDVGSGAYAALAALGAPVAVIQTEWVG